MNQLAIFFLLPIFYVSCAPKLGDVICKFRKASIVTVDGGPGSQTFDVKSTCLYKTVGSSSRVLETYVIDDLHTRSKEFAILQCNTIVSETKVTVFWEDCAKCIILEVYGKTWDFYLKVLPKGLDGLNDEFSVNKFILEGYELDDVSVIRAKKVEYRGWVFVAMGRNNKPRFIFPSEPVELSEKADSDKEVTFYLLTRPITIVSVQFDDSTGANNFYSFVKERFRKSAY